MILFSTVLCWTLGTPVALVRQRDGLFVAGAAQRLAGLADAGTKIGRQIRVDKSHVGFVCQFVKRFVIVRILAGMRPHSHGVSLTEFPQGGHPLGFQHLGLELQVNPVQTGPIAASRIEPSFHGGQVFDTSAQVAGHLGLFCDSQ